MICVIYILNVSNFLIQEWTFTPPDPEKLPSIPSSVSTVTYQYMYWHILHMSHWYILEYTPFITHWNILAYTLEHYMMYFGTYPILVHTEMYMYSMCHKLVYWKSKLYVSHCNNTLHIYMYIIFLYTDRQFWHWKRVYHAN